MRIERESPEGVWLRARWNTLLSMAPIAVGYIKWIVTGIAGILAVILASLDSIASHVSAIHFRWGTSLLVLSLMVGSLACLLSLSLSAGVKTRKRAEKTEKESKDESLVVTTALLEEFQKPFWGLLRWVVKRSLRKAIADPLYGEKNGIFTICLLNLLILSTVALAGSGLVVLVIGMNASPPTATQVGPSKKEPNQTSEPTSGLRPAVAHL